MRNVAPRIFVDLPLAAGQRIRLSPGPSQHLVQVLRLRAGESLALFNGDGRDYGAHLLTPTRGGALVELGTPGEIEPLPRLRLHLGIGVSKGERMDFALQKSVELGVARITPLFTERSIVHLAGDRLVQRHRHWQGVVVSACEQSGRRRLPDLMQAEALNEWLAQDHPCPLLLDRRSHTPLPELAAPAEALTLLVGPEGGLAAAERSAAAMAGFIPVRLGPRVLRAETAPLAALAVVQALWGDFLS